MQQEKSYCHHWKSCFSSAFYLFYFFFWKKRANQVYRMSVFSSARTAVTQVQSLQELNVSPISCQVLEQVYRFTIYNVSTVCR